MRKIVPAILFLVALVTISTGLHKFYVSLCQVDHNREARSLEITMKIFTDDLEYAITGTPPFYGLGSEFEPDDADSVLFRYIKKNFHVKLDDTLRQPIYIGKEVEFDVTWCYIEIENVQNFRRIEITNRMLTEIYEDQLNIVNINARGKVSGMLLNRSETTRTIHF